MSVASRASGRISKPGEQWSASRRTPSTHFPELARHNQHVGEVLHAFNTAQASFFIVFWRLLGEKYDLAAKLWHSQPSDTSQRAMLEIWIRSEVRRKSIQNGLLWALKAMNELTVFRNDAVHADVLWYYEKLVPGLGTKEERRKRLLALPLEKRGGPLGNYELRQRS